MESGALDNYGWIEIVFVGVVALGLGFWQLWSINREIAKDKERQKKLHLRRTKPRVMFLWAFYMATSPGSPD